MEKISRIHSEIENLSSDDFLNILNKFVKINTSNPPGETYRDYINTISPFFKDLGYEIEEVILPEEVVNKIPYPIKGPRINLLAKKKYGKEKDISFYGHMDVVPANDEAEKKWRFPPFEVTMIKSGKIYGRGVADMKGSMVCLIKALQIINKLNLTPKYNIQILNCTDEELGIEPGIKYLSEQGYVKGTIFCMDGPITPWIIAGCAGALTITIESIGKSCHAGLSFMGVNALEETIPIMVELMNLKKKVENRESIDIIGLERDEKGRPRNMLSKFNIDVIQAGDKTNVVPGKCILKIDRRIIPDEKYEDVKQEIIEAIEIGKEKSRLFDVKTTFTYDNPALKVNPNAPDLIRMKKVMGIARDLSEDKIRVVGLSSSTDMGYVNEILKSYDVIFHGLINPGSNPHGVNETIKFSDAKTFIKEIILFLCADV